MEINNVSYTKWVEWVDEEEKRMLKEVYKAAKTEVMLVVTVAKTTTFEWLYVELGDNAGIRECIG